VPAVCRSARGLVGEEADVTKTIGFAAAAVLLSAGRVAQAAGQTQAEAVADFARGTSLVELGTLLVLAIGGLAALKLRRRST
jgi:hypothetical protein